MAFKITEAYIRGTWDGTPYSSNFAQDATVFTSRWVPDFYADYVAGDVAAVVAEYDAVIIQRKRSITEDGKVMINTIEFPDEATHDTYMADPRWANEEAATKKYAVEEAPTPEDVNTFDEGLEIYYHTTAHLI